ncbi:MAG: Alcohol dehydrogenase GroES domain protein [Paenibacillaceae bacterium]|jgi:threonine dehydrogenase-like Zn-dependent dehydrogenase|nr:Alcohol dehydrogenase GroES domain protein [Paenibacillaceae bacterium]
MKHVVMKGPKTSAVVDIQDLQPNDDQVLIRLKYVGVCMSEHYDWSVAKEGKAFGHEPMGIIAAAGKNVTGYKVGDRVSGMWGSTLPGSGGMIEYAVTDPKKSTLVVIPEQLGDTDAILEPLACIMSAVSKVKIPMPGTRVCVVGAGYMGCGAISLLKTRGAYVVAVDLRPESLENAKKYGADEIYLADDAKEQFRGDTKGTGFDVVMEWGETEDSLDLAINLTNYCGQLCIGAYHTGGKRLVDVQQLNLKAIECLSVHPREQHLNDIGARNAINLLSSGAWKFVQVPTKIYPRNKFDQAHEELETKYGRYMKAVIDMTAEDFEPYIIYG